eukprot:jgi/Picsp_1/1986/NSC_05452-R1_---NA---
MSNFAPALKHLVSGETNADKSLAALAISTMCNEGHEPPDDIVDEIHRGLFNALDQKDDAELQVNALVAIAAMNAASERFPNLSGLEQMQKILAALSMMTESSLEARHDNRAQCNALGAIASYCRREDKQEPARILIRDTDALSKSIEFANHSSHLVRAAAADAACSMISHSFYGAEAKNEAVKLDLISSFISSLCRNNDTAARQGMPEGQKEEGRESEMLMLLCIGMMIQQDQGGQQFMAQDPASIRYILACVRQKDDADIHIVAKEILGVLAGNKGLQEHLTESIRAAQDSHQANLAYSAP